MNEGRSDAQASDQVLREREEGPGEAPEEGPKAGRRLPWRARLAANGVADLAQAPVLSALATVAAFVDLALKRVVLPPLSGRVEHGLLLRAHRWGDFASNLCAVAAVAAILAGLVVFVRSDRHTNLLRRVMLACFGAMFLATGAFAAVGPQYVGSIGQLVRFGTGAANVLGVLVMMIALRKVERPMSRVVAGGAALVASFSLLAQVTELFGRRKLSAQALGAYEVLRGLGECCYLALLVAAAVLFVPRGRGWRDRVAVGAGGVLAGLAGTAAYMAQAQFGRDYRLLLYHAQRVAWFLDSAVGLYVVPLGIGIGGALAALLSCERVRVQAGMGMTLLLSAAYAPRAPGRLLMLVLGMILLARALIAREQPRAKSGSASTSPPET